MAHFPCAQRDPSELGGDDGQAVPQAPQFSVLVFRSTQVLSHKVSVFFAQAGPHRPFRHFSWLLQERPQTPQCFVSVRIFTQELLQTNWPAEQESSGVIVTPAVAVETGVSSGGGTYRSGRSALSGSPTRISRSCHYPHGGSHISRCRGSGRKGTARWMVWLWELPSRGLPLVMAGEGLLRATRGRQTPRSGEISVNRNRKTAGPAVGCVRPEIHAGSPAQRQARLNTVRSPAEWPRSREHQRCPRSRSLLPLPWDLKE